MAKIYVIDDESSIRRLIKMIMEEQKHEVTTFATAEEGLKVIEKEPPDLLFTDLGLPEMNGLELIKIVEERLYSFPIVVVSEITIAEAIIEAFKHGICDFITKPFTPTEIIESFEKCYMSTDTLLKKKKEVISFVEAGKNLQASKLVSRLFANFPNSPVPHYLFALLAFSWNKELAKRHLKAALALDPDYKEARELLIKIDSGDEN
ncbi:MAG: response regulator [Thermotogae bacterium]|uniref:Response regulator n=1 Tax=Kosmotoga arenicorallina TaxID=688066 RepID=A0A7C5DZ33_9BACT|nr:response regulator [Kosmotoga sp.]MBO8167065.1 response regulator [Kosmotoga sp.]MCD6159575.1 response regulator [Kosmotoga sp.]RKX50141.1 MAG: response regulator [Thermotogota bacterium]HHF08143.1 response regulator [Kosmotoga arenicorallina]